MDQTESIEPGSKLDLSRTIADDFELNRKCGREPGECLDGELQTLSAQQPTHPREPEPYRAARVFLALTG